MLRVWLIVPLALSFFCLSYGMKLDLSENLLRAGGETQILETLDFWVRARGDKRGLTEGLEVLRREAGYSGVGLCYQNRLLMQVGELMGGCGENLENMLVNSWEKGLKSSDSYSVLAENRAFSSLAGLFYFFGLLLFSSFVFFGILLMPGLAPKPVSVALKMKTN